MSEAPAAPGQAGEAARGASSGTVLALVSRLAQALLAQGGMLATAESCTGGLIAAACTGLAGSSAWFDRGFVTYSNAAKTDLLSVPPGLIAQHGAVSEPVVRAMVEGALRHSAAHAAVAVTGIAGPGGSSADKPVGTVWLGWGLRDQSVVAQRHLFAGGRDEVRQAACVQALSGLLTLLDTSQTF